VASTVENAAVKSAGAPLAASVKGEMEAGFGADFSNVRVHTGAPAAEAAGGLNAHAFTTGSDIFFNAGAYDPGSDQGKKLIAHELAHVVQSERTAASPSAQASVSKPGDSHEVEADAAASTVVGGGKADGLGAAPAAVHRDAIGDVSSTASGNWMGNVNEGEALRRLATLSPDEKRRIATEDTHRQTITRLARAFNKAEMLRMFDVVGAFELRWKIYYLQISGVVSDLNQTEWRRVVGVASPQDMDNLRVNPGVYRAFVTNGPDAMVPPWDRLQALKEGWWHGTPVAVRLALNSLSPDQRVTVRADDAMVRAIVLHSGNAAETFRAITYLNFPVKWSIHWLNQAHHLAGLTQQQWSQLLAEAPKAEFDELVGWTELWSAVQRLCPPSVLQVVRQNTADPNTITTQLADPVAVDLLIRGTGAAAVLAMATQPGTDVAANYAHLKTGNKHLQVLNGLERGMRMGERTQANLGKWFDATTGETSLTTLELMATVRFNCTFGAGGGSGPVAGGGGPVHNGATLTNWSVAGIRRLWTIMERMPPAQVESNPALAYMLMNTANNGGYYAGTDTSSSWDNSSVVGLQGNPDAVMSSKSIYGGTMPQFNQTTRHEIGHAVDNQLTIMAAVQDQEWAGAWVNHGSASGWVNSLIAAGGGLSGHGYPATEAGDYQAAMLQAATNGSSFMTALNAIRAGKGLGPATHTPTVGPAALVNDLNAWHHGQSFWNKNAWKPQNGRNFVRGYGDNHHWWSFSNAKLAKKATDYQFRAPKEWFADAYAVYYAEQEGNPNVPVGGLLRSKDADAANFISSQIDRGYSPQLMAGGVATAAPGAVGGVGGAKAPTGH
jgi:hypothetical protein